MNLIPRLPAVRTFLSRVQPLRIDGAEVAGSSELDVFDPSSGAVLCRIASAEPAAGPTSSAISKRKAAFIARSPVAPWLAAACV